MTGVTIGALTVLVSRPATAGAGLPRSRDGAAFVKGVDAGGTPENLKLTAPSESGESRCHARVRLDIPGIRPGARPAARSN